VTIELLTVDIPSKNPEWLFFRTWGFQLLSVRVFRAAKETLTKRSNWALLGFSRCVRVGYLRVDFLFFQLTFVGRKDPKK
jgi:hypothetical protein